MKKGICALVILLAMIVFSGCTSGCNHGYLQDGPAVGTSRTVTDDGGKTKENNADDSSKADVDSSKADDSSAA